MEDAERALATKQRQATDTNNVQIAGPCFVVRCIPNLVLVMASGHLILRRYAHVEQLVTSLTLAAVSMWVCVLSKHLVRVARVPLAMSAHEHLAAEKSMFVRAKQVRI